MRVILAHLHITSSLSKRILFSNLGCKSAVGTCDASDEGPHLPQASCGVCGVDDGLHQAAIDVIVQRYAFRVRLQIPYRDRLACRADLPACL